MNACEYDLRTQDIVERGMGIVFANDALSDTALDAAGRTDRAFSEFFPGWELYRRVVAGQNIFDGVLDDWAVTCARQLAGALKDNGRDYISPKTRRKNGWVDQAGRDALAFVVSGAYPAGQCERAEQYGVSHVTYRKIRLPVAKCIDAGLRAYTAELYANFWLVRADERRAVSRGMRARTN